MAIRQLSLNDFRNLRSTTLDFHDRLNLVTGSNGSGKTSLLEAVHVLCQAHSFRTHQLRQCIRHDSRQFLLFGRFDDFKAGLSRSQEKLEIHVDGEKIKRRSELVRKAPILVLNADSFSLIEGSPQQRRAYMDWALFHVEHDFALRWSEFRHALRQRNRLLKNRRDLQLLDYWDESLVTPSLELDRMRRRFAEELEKILVAEFDDLLGDLSLGLSYQPGWKEGESLAEVLRQQRQRDLQSGFTQSGVHRADIRLDSKDHPASEVLSRGQSKRVCLALLLGALKLVATRSGQRIILLIDDLNAELDEAAREQVYQRLFEMDLQLIISNIDSPIPASAGAKEFKWFHVEHGIIRPRNFS